MSSKTAQAANKKTAAFAAAAASRRARRKLISWTAAVVVALGTTFGLYSVFHRASTSASSYTYQVGAPGVGAQAPGFTLPATSGGTVSLASLRGKTVLLYFQEGLDCQPCWTQIQQLEAASAQVRAAGIDRVFSITTDPVNLLIQRVHDMSLSTAVLSDTSLTVSQAYDANQYGMMGTSMDGHSFILVGPTGKILWRADYGGAPNYTMDVPVSTLLSQLKAGEVKS